MEKRWSHSPILPLTASRVRMEGVSENSLLSALCSASAARDPINKPLATHRVFLLMYFSVLMFLFGLFVCVYVILLLVCLFPLSLLIIFFFFYSGGTSSETKFHGCTVIGK